MIIQTLIICIQGVCFNPANVTYLTDETNKRDGYLSSCYVSFVKYGVSVKNTTCEALAAEINAKVKEGLK